MRNDDDSVGHARSGYQSGYLLKLSAKPHLCLALWPRPVGEAHDDDDDDSVGRVRGD